MGFVGLGFAASLRGRKQGAAGDRPLRDRPVRKAPVEPAGARASDYFRAGSYIQKLLMGAIALCKNFS
jgi:hypothetical protein